MIRKFTAYIFILLANLIILAHTVVPHHHHQNIACIESARFRNHDIAHKPHAPVDNHQHDGGSSTNCILKQAVIVHLNEGKDETDCVVCSHNHSFQFTLPYSGNEALLPVFKSVATIPVESVSFFSYISPSLGLRAPPVA